MAEEEPFMSQDYLLKTEPSEYSFAELQRDKTTVWDGVSNPAALKHMREMKPGARLVIYETGDRKIAVGTASVVSVGAVDLRNKQIEIKAEKLFADSPLVRQGRLSVAPLTTAQYKFLTGG